MLQQEIFSAAEPAKLLPIVEPIEGAIVPTNIWDIPQTISQLSYLTHNHYRYYGKFPSAVAAQIINQHYSPGKKGVIYDHFSGSGTTLVEAKLRGAPSLGMDISWISVLVSNVKVRPVNFNILRDRADKLIRDAAIVAGSLNEASDPFARKWFDDDAILKLRALQICQMQLERSAESDFLLVAFLGIVRRASKAHDGEVRPHVNKQKRPREVFSAFRKKVADMMARHHEFQQITDASVRALCVQGNNAFDAPPLLADETVALAVSHPPYLNSFNYRPVYSLEFYWGKPFEEMHSTRKAEHDVSRELIAHPANDANIEKYFSHLRSSYTVLHGLLRRQGKVAIVIGDCTRAGKLVPVIEETISICEDIGLKLVERNYRTTHYGLGKYAYKHRADYHGDHQEKRDGIIVFSKR